MRTQLVDNLWTDLLQLVCRVVTTCAFLRVYITRAFAERSSFFLSYLILFFKPVINSYLSINLKHVIDADETRSLVLKPVFHSIISLPRRKIMTAKLYFRIPSQLKKLSWPSSRWTFFRFYFIFCSWNQRTLNKFSCCQNFSPAAAKYVSGNRALDLQHFVLTATPRGPLLNALAFLWYLILLFNFVINRYPSPNSKHFVATDGPWSLDIPQFA